MNLRSPILAMTALAALAGCTDDPSAPEGTVPVSLSVAVGSTVPVAADRAATPLLARSEAFDDGTNELVIDRAALVLSEIELEGTLDACDAPTFDDDGYDDDGCEEFDAGPFLLELPLDGNVDQVLEVFVASGVYSKLEFELDKVDDDDAAETAFLQAHPEFDGVSVRVEGTWNGEPFVFVQQVDAEHELYLNPALEVAEGGEARNLTLRLDISSWFMRGDGTLVDPATALGGQPNEELVEDNIERSFELFEDDDHDGEHDELEVGD